MKASIKLAKEMDIKQFIQRLRASRNAMKFLTTQQERRIVKMQADQNLFTLKETDKKLLNIKPTLLHPNDLNMLIGDSSEFSS